MYGRTKSGGWVHSAVAKQVYIEHLLVELRMLKLPTAKAGSPARRAQETTYHERLNYIWRELAALGVKLK